MKLYWKVYPAHGNDLSSTIRLLAGAVLEPRKTQLGRWFFLRYVDARGPHVRLRLDGPDDVLDGVDGDRDSVYAALRHVRATHRRPPFKGAVFDPWRDTSASSPSILGAIYEPETAKWGTGKELDSAESFFQVSSEFAVSVIREEPEIDPLGMLVLATQFARVAAESFAGPHGSTLLLRHADWWRHGHPQAALAEIGAASNRHVRRLSEANQQLSSAAAQAAARLMQFFTSLRTPAFAGAKSPTYQFHHQMHLTMNRLGVLPPYEIVVAEAAARALSLDLRGLS